jgi:hypothetical protein
MSKESSSEQPSGCTASAKERRKWCNVTIPSYNNCVEGEHCPYADYQVNLGQPFLRGGIETSDDSAKWRHLKKVYGIPHGDD